MQVVAADLLSSFKRTVRSICMSPCSRLSNIHPAGIHRPVWFSAKHNCSLENSISFMQGNTQGPCSLEQLIFWLDLLKHEKDYQKEYEDFKEVSVWIVSSSQALESVELVCMDLLNVSPCNTDRTSWPVSGIGCQLADELHILYPVTRKSYAKAGSTE